MGEAELAVLVMALLVGLFVGLLLAWSSLLASPGHPPRTMARETGSARGEARRPEAHAGRASLGAHLAILAAASLALLMVPDLAGALPPLEDLPVSSFVLAFAALLISVGYALPTWLGVRR